MKTHTILNYLRILNLKNFYALVGKTTLFCFRSTLFFYLASQAEVLDHSRTPCTNPKDFIPDTKDKIYVFYIRMEHPKDYTTWINVARCFRIWDLEARGFHKSLWRMWIKGNHVLYVGCPASPYCSHKPTNVEAIYMPNKETRPPDNNFFAK